MTTYAKDDLKKILDLHYKWWVGGEGGVRADLRSADLSGADLRSADLSGADLRSADLSGADLRSADLSGADLSGAVLRSADLRSADLSGAVLRSADLRSADLSGADLRSADLSGAVLRSADLRSADLSDDTVLSDGVWWGEYKKDLVPALCTAGGKSLADVATEDTWNCHKWGSDGKALGCPMAVAFGVERLEQIPVLHRWQAERFIQLFDARLIPRPAT